jgi:hypothetical protein
LSARDGLWTPTDDAEPEWLKVARQDEKRFIKALTEPEPMTSAAPNGQSQLATALVAARSEMHAIAKDSTNPHFKSKYASLDVIIETVVPILNGHGLTLIQGCVVPCTDEHGKLTAFTVRTTLLHVSGESLDRDVVMPVAKSDPQGAGAALTYGRRYGISALLGLATDEDDDGNNASRGKAASSQRAERKPANVNTNAVPANVNNTSGPVMPVGKSKGKPLASLDELTLIGALKWMQENNPTRYAKDVAAIEGELESRRLAEVTT